LLKPGDPKASTASKTSALFKGISLLIKSTALKIDKKQR
jgi:hypothetical protein